MGHNRNLADYAHHFDGTNIDLGSGNIETEGVLTYEDVTNVDAIGIITARAGVKVPDSQKVLLGTGDDLQIWHAPNISYFANYTGELIILNQTNDGDVSIHSDNGSGGTSPYFRADGSTGETILYHYGNKKLNTTTTGATVTGTLVSDSVTSELDLSAISASISDTAVHVFVYDTRKDSDGGAWRKRTQHTSWYNETLNTSTRGSRKEFPAVAVIVTETRKVTIYDGDDPDLPMWMIFNAGSGNALYYPNSSNGTSTVMLNGKLANAASGGSPRFRTIDFLSDSHLEYSHTDGRTTFNINVSQRNAGLATFNYGNVPGSGIIHRDCNDVAITVLPNAPIDDATGLPVPTIAVGTNDGVSVIKDDGTVISTASSSGGYYIKKVDFTDDHGLNAHIDSNSGGNKALVYVDDFNKLNGFSYGTYSNWDGVLYANRYAANVLTYRTLSQGSGFPISDFISMSGTDAAIGSNFTAGGLTLLAKNNEAPGQGMVAFVTSDYNTGYMQGDIKGAFLSDTDTTNVTGSEKIANNTFAADFSTQWEVANNANTSYDATNDRVTVTSTQNYSGIRLKSGSLPTLTQGKRYIMSIDIHSITNPIRFGVVSGGTKDGVNSTGPHTLTFTAGATISEVFIQKGTGSNSTFVLNSVSIREAEEDRSVNNNGLQVYGTVTKSAIATGADLVAYSGFNHNNYLRQPHNADLNVGTGDFYIMCWAKGNRYMLWHRKDGGSLDMRCEFPSSGGSANKPRFLMSNGGVSLSFYATHAFDTTTWHHCVWVKRGARNGELYIDGVLNNSGSASSDLNLNGTNSTFSIGNRADNPTEDFNGYVSLFRFGASAPSPEQIKKIYEDEKVLFQENAKATLYGSSDAVTALAYDDDTDFLHVGTSSGRSDFQGLRRINNTTTAVTTAITAQNEFIIEQ